MPEARQLRASRVREIAKPIAAGLLIGAFLWVAATTMRVANTGVNNDIATAIQGGRSGAGAVAGKKARPNAAPGAPGSTTASAQTGFFGRMRQVIATRAAYQVTESFHAGMSAWGDPKSGAPAGWSHSADGYVRPAALAFFRPSMEFRDYRMEFFGQIEDKSMSWAVRAHDAKNYYAMKVKVLEPGLRETVALEHYPVVAGIKGHKVEVPLPQIMIHSRTPYHVEVAVRGNRITASIEGQQVDSWTDDILPKGGVGLFAEAGERARVYWLKVSRNEDFIGRVCAYISGNSGDAADSIADLWRGEGTPAGPAQPGNGLPAERADIGLATAFALRSTGRRRFPKWRS
jgi:hypothetical protein